MFLNELLIILTAYSILTYIIKPRMDVLCCGLFCYTGGSPADPWKLKILALYNEKRGEHATGICVNNDILKETDAAKEFLANNAVAFDFSIYDFVNFTFLGHCRQATYAYNKDNKNFAHPHATTFKGKDLLRLVHNGTITNCYDLSKKYDLKYYSSEKSDSILLAEILTLCWKDQNMDVLKEYDGAATIVFYDVSRPNTLYVHRDKARELFYWQENKESCYISSIKSSLQAIGADPADIKEFEPGILVRFVKGKITKTWDLTEKKAYSVPRTVYNQPAKKINSSSYPARAQAPIPPVKKEGYYWQDFLIRKDGHLITGSFYVHKKTNKVLKYVNKVEKPEYDEYQAIMGVVMKDGAAYSELYKLCQDANGEFSVPEYNRIPVIELCKYALYPVLGKVYSDNDTKIFWHPALKDVNLTETYDWSPVLSNEKYSINRAGLLMSQESTVTKPMTQEDTIEYLLKAKVSRGERYTTMSDLHLDVKSMLNMTSVTLPFDDFFGVLLRFFKNRTNVNRAVLNGIIRNREIYEGYEYTSWDNGDTVMTYYREATSLLLEAQDDIQEELGNTHITDNLDIVPTENGAVSDESDVEVIPSFHEDLQFYQTQAFKDQILFTDYDDMDDIMQNYLETDEPAYILPLFKGIAILFRELGLMSQTEVLAVENRQTATVKSELNRYFQSIKKSPMAEKVRKVFESGLLTDKFGELYQDYLKFDQKQSLTKEQETEFTIVKLGLNYIINRGKNIDKKALLEKYQITEKQLGTVCS